MAFEFNSPALDTARMTPNPMLADIANELNAVTGPSFGDFLKTNSFDLASLGVGMMSNFFSNRAQAKAYEAQAKLTLLADRQQGLYEQEQLRAQAKDIFSQSTAFSGIQKVAMAASGFADYSTGDVRMLADTARKQAAAVDSLNQSYTAQRQESEKQALMNAISLRAAAKGAKISAWTGLATGALQARAMYGSYQHNAKKQQKIASALGALQPFYESMKTTTKTHGYRGPIVSPV